MMEDKHAPTCHDDIDLAEEIVTAIVSLIKQLEIPARVRLSNVVVVNISDREIML